MYSQPRLQQRQRLPWQHRLRLLPFCIASRNFQRSILLSTLITAVGTRFVGMDSPAEDTMWLVDRLTGNVYKCQTSERGRASCEPDIATGSIGDRGKR